MITFRQINNSGIGIIIIFLITVMVIIPPAFADANPWKDEDRHPERFYDSKRPDPALMLVDGIVVRPVSFVATVVGSVFYVLTLPFSASGGNKDAAWDQMVAAPARTTFSRPLGVFYLDFDDQKGGVQDDITSSDPQSKPLNPE